MGGVGCECVYIGDGGDGTPLMVGCGWVAGIQFVVRRDRDMENRQGLCQNLELPERKREPRRKL